MKPVKPLFLLPLLFLLACKKESFTGSRNALLSTTDTLHFDTVFASAGSTTQAIKIFNPHNKGIHISSVQLAGGTASPFHINVNGQPGPTVTQVDIGPDDSAYVFVSVTINPTAANLPFIVRDSIELLYNGNKQFIQLDAYG